MKTLLQELEARCAEFFQNHDPRCEAPWIRLVRKGKDQPPQTAQLLAVGSDFIEVGMILAAPLGKAHTQIVSRDQIAEVVWVGESN